MPTRREQLDEKYGHRGEEDGRKGIYNPPHTFLEELLGHDDMEADNKAYRNGNRLTRED